MVIDFDKITEEHIEGFKGGEGKLDTRAYVDNKARIMYQHSDREHEVESIFIVEHLK